MKNRSRYISMLAGLAAFALAAGSLSAQTHVTLTNLLFAEDFSGYTPGGLPTTVDAGGRWATVTWPNVGGAAEVVVDTEELFDRGAANQFFRVTSTSNLTLVTTNFFRSQDVVSLAFDYIGRNPEDADGNRWLNVNVRAGTLVAHTTSIRNRTNTLRGATNGVTIPTSAEVPIGSLGDRTRVVTIVNNRADTISYDRPDGQGVATLTSTNAAVWVYRYTGENAGTWTNLFAEDAYFTFNRATTIALGDILDNVQFTLDGNAVARSFDMDEITIHGNLGAFPPPVYVAITNQLFSEDFESYDPGMPPTTVEAGGKWGTATWNGTNGSWGVLEDVENTFGQGTANRFLQLSNTHNLNPGLITPVFEPQDALIFSFDFIGRIYANDGNRWINIDVRNAAGAFHTTSLRMFVNTIRKVAPEVPYPANNMPFRILTVVNNREGPILYDRPDGLGTTNLGAAKASVWLYDGVIDEWEHTIPEYIFSRTVNVYGEVMDRLRFFMDSNAVFRSLDIDNIEVLGAKAPAPTAIVLTATRSGGDIEIRWDGQAGKTYQVQYRDSLTSGTWENLGGLITPGADGEQLATDSLSASDARFYQVIEQ